MTSLAGAIEVHERLHQRFQNENDQGVRSDLFIIIESAFVRAHACSDGYTKDRSNQEDLPKSRWIDSQKIHAVVDALGHPLKYHITQAKSLLKNKTVLADKGQDSHALI